MRAIGTAMLVQMLLTATAGCLVSAPIASVDASAPAGGEGDDAAAAHDAPSPPTVDGSTKGREDDELTIRAIMREAMTRGLCKKVVKDEATEEEQRRLATLFESLAQLEPPKGSRESWTEKTEALLSAAKDVAEAMPAHKALASAANCTACHKVHRP
jgi:hypothetical protein